MPAPENSRQLDLGQGGQDLEALKDFGMTGYGMYVTTQKPDSLKAFYEAKMSEKGWKKGSGDGPDRLIQPGSTVLAGNTSLSYQKDKKVSMIVIVGPLTAAQIQSLQEGFKGDTPKPGQTLVMLMEMDLSKLLPFGV